MWAITHSHSSTSDPLRKRPEKLRNWAFCAESSLFLIVQMDLNGSPEEFLQQPVIGKSGWCWGCISKWLLLAILLTVLTTSGASLIVKNDEYNHYYSNLLNLMKPFFQVLQLSLQLFYRKGKVSKFGFIKRFWIKNSGTIDIVLFLFLIYIFFIDIFFIDTMFFSNDCHFKMIRNN